MKISDCVDWFVIYLISLSGVTFLIVQCSVAFS